VRERDAAPKQAVREREIRERERERERDAASKQVVRERGGEREGDRERCSL